MKALLANQGHREVKSKIMSNNPSHEAALFCRYILSSLDRLLQCLEGLNKEQLNWRPPAPNTNSLYALAVHTMANAEENILYTLYNRPSPRNREQEFLAQGVSADALISQWQDLRERLQDTLLGLTSEDLERAHIHPRRDTIETVQT